MDGKESYSFVNETIKKKPVNKRKLFKKSMVTIVSAVAFGFIACLTFLLLEPVISKKLSPEEITKIELPETEDEISPEELLTDEIVEQEDAELEEQFNSQINEQITEQIQQEVSDKDLAIKTYQAAYDALYKVAMEASQTIVVVTGVSTDTDWFLNEVENINETSGVVIAKSEKALYILADVNGLPDAESYMVTFSGKNIVEANLLRSDPDTGLGIFTVAKSNLTNEQWSSQGVIELANSKKANIVGRPVVAVGSPLGQSGSICYGIVTSNQKEISYADYHYNVLTTDITGSETNSSGIIVNTSGKLIGVITSESSSAASGALLACFGISDIKKLVEQLSNEEDRIYLGIHGASVTGEIHNVQNIPYGVYVTEVDPGSPAFDGGINNADVVIAINDTEIKSLTDYMNCLDNLSADDFVKIELARYDGEKYVTTETEIRPKVK